MKKTTTVTVALGIALSFTQLAAAATIRNHYVVAERNRHHVFEVTRIHDQGATSVTRTFLIADTNGPFARVDVVTDYARNKALTTYKLLRGSAQTATITEDLPFSTNTPSGHRDEMAKNPQLRDAPVPVTIEGPGGSVVRGTHKEWMESNTADLRRGDVKKALGKELFDALDAMRELAGLPMFADLNVGFGYLFDEAKIVRKSAKLMVAFSNVDCAFDSKFGVPCGS